MTGMYKTPVKASSLWDPLEMHLIIVVHGPGVWEGLRASQHGSYWSLTQLAQFAQLAKQPSLTFPAQFFSKLLFALKIRAGKGTAHPNVPRARLLMLCWGCEKCVELLLFIHFRALEDLLYIKDYFVEKSYFFILRCVLSEEAPAPHRCEWLSPLLSSCLAMSEFA